MDERQSKVNQIDGKRGASKMNRFGEERRLYLGASEVAGAIGMSQYNSPKDVWLRKTGRKEKQEHLRIFDRGYAMEDVMVDLLKSDFNREITDREKEFTHKEHSFLKCHIDGLVQKWTPLFDGDQNEKQGIGVLEMKAPSSWKAKEYAEQGLLSDYLIQGQTALACSGYDWVSFCFLDYDAWELVVMDIDRDQEFIDRIVAKAVEFWGCVERDEVPPEEVEKIEIPELLKKVEIIEPTQAILDYKVAKQNLDFAKLEVDNIKSLVAKQVGESERLVYDGVASISYKYGKPRETIAGKDLLAYAERMIEDFNPEPFVKRSKPSRVMRISLKK